MTKPVLHECPYHVTCDTYNCRTMAKWFLGREDEPLQLKHKLCDSCAKHLVTNLPKELIEAALDTLSESEFKLEPGEPLVNQEVLDKMESDILTGMGVSPEALETELKLPDDYDGMNIRELRELAKRLNMSGYSGLSKEELIEAIKGV